MLFKIPQTACILVMLLTIALFQGLKTNIFLNVIFFTNTQYRLTFLQENKEACRRCSVYIVNF